MLSHLESRLPLLTKASRGFALAILFQNGVELSDSQFPELMEEALTAAYRPLIAGLVSQSEPIRKALLKMVDTGVEDHARNAADVLLERAKSQLDEEHFVRCRVLTLEADLWCNPEFASELERMRAYPEYAELIVEEAQRLVQRGFKRPLIDQIYEAEQTPSLWNDIIWNELCENSRMRDVESRGQWILEFLLKVPTSREAIGKAAHKYLFDERMVGGFGRDEASSWLALLAHEAGQLSEDELGSVVDRIDPNDKSAFVPLITRLGREPNNDRSRRYYHQIARERNNDELPASETPTFERFLEYARPGAFHPKFCALIERSMYNDPFSDEQLQSIANIGEHGTLVAIVLTSSYGKLPKPEWVVTVLGVKPAGQMQNQPCQRSIVSRWDSILFATKTDTVWRDSYLEKLKQAITPPAAHLSEIAVEMLSIDPSLSLEHLRILLTHLVGIYYDDDKLCAHLSKLLADPKNEDLLKQAAASVDAGIADLDLQPWDVDEARPKDAGAYLMFPLLRWRISGVSDITSRRVFLLGLKMALFPPRRADGELTGAPTRFVGIGDVAPLILATSRSILEEAIRYSEAIDDFELGAMCRLFLLKEIKETATPAGVPGVNESS